MHLNHFEVATEVSDVSQPRPRTGLDRSAEPARIMGSVQTKVWARAHAGEEMQDPEFYPKAELIFPSGESLPKAWIDPHYRANVPMPEHLSAAR